jgi:hypothetical protein
MKQSIEEILSVIYQYYPRGLAAEGPYFTSEEDRRLVEARKRAGGNRSRWLAMLARLSDRFPDCTVHDGSVHLPLGEMDAAHCGELFLPTARKNEHHHVGFMVSFLLPVYVIYDRKWATGEAYEGSLDRWTETRLGVSNAYARGAAEEIASEYPGYEPMPPDVGRLIVPDVETPQRSFGKVTILDCLCSDFTRWLPPRYYELAQQQG